MKSKASLVLMEQLIMVLVFALAAALCLSLFAASHRIAKETALREEGAIVAQNAAELLKSGGDVSLLDTGDYTLDIQEAASPVPGWLRQVCITVLHNNKPVFSLETGWQEAIP